MRHPFDLMAGTPRALSLLYRAWVWYGPLLTTAYRAALSRLLEEC